MVRLWPIRTHDILQRQDALGKGKLRSLVGGAIYASVIWQGMKWNYASGPDYRLLVRLGLFCWLQPGRAAFLQMLGEFSVHCGKT